MPFCARETYLLDVFKRGLLYNSCIYFFKLYLPFCAPPVPIAAIAVCGLAREAKPVFPIFQTLDLLLQLPLLKHLQRSKRR